MPSQEPLYLDGNAKTPIAPEAGRHRMAGSGLTKWQ